MIFLFKVAYFAAITTLLMVNAYQRNMISVKVIILPSQIKYPNPPITDPNHNRVYIIKADEPP
jgi:hypothetical protein